MSVYEGHGVTLHHADCLDVLRSLPDCSVDAVVTDPPYGLEFMGKEWDAPWKQGADVHAEARNRRAEEMGDENKRRYIASAVNKYAAGLPFQQWCEMWATECLRVLKPGGHLLAFGGTRTWHRLACAVEDAGFEVRDPIAWMYGSGFPKSHDVSKAIDKAAGAEREVVGRYQPPNGTTWNLANDEARASIGPVGHSDRAASLSITAPATDAAREWEGWGTALKPAFEPVVVARKPLIGTVAATVLAHGTGALNIDGCRIGLASGEDVAALNARSGGRRGFASEYVGGTDHPLPPGADLSKGRWPANVVLDESQAEALDEQSGTQRDGTAVNRNKDPKAEKPHEVYGGGWLNGDRPDITHGGQGGASRFFYVAKADATERPRVNGTAHPTVKPLSLMRWLVRLVTPPGGTVLEPFAGSGTTVEACIIEGFQCIAIEREADYLPLIRQRIDRRRDPVEALRGQAADLGLFDLLGGEGA